MDISKPIEDLLVLITTMTKENEVPTLHKCEIISQAYIACEALVNLNSIINKPEEEYKNLTTNEKLELYTKAIEKTGIIIELFKMKKEELQKT